MTFASSDNYMINIAKSWLFRNKWRIFAQKHLQAKHNMQILLANAKIMFGKADRKPISTPLFQTVAYTLAAEMARMDVEDLARQLDCSKKIAAENWQRYHNFMAAQKMPALLAYNGQAYKHLRAHTLSDEALRYAQKHQAHNADC